MPYHLMVRYSEIFEVQHLINEIATSVYAELQKATSVLNTEQENLDRNDEDRVQHHADNVDSRSNPRTSTTNTASAEEDEVNLKTERQP